MMALTVLITGAAVLVVAAIAGLLVLLIFGAASAQRERDADHL